MSLQGERSLDIRILIDVRNCIICQHQGLLMKSMLTSSKRWPSTKCPIRAQDMTRMLENFLNRRTMLGLFIFLMMASIGSPTITTMSSTSSSIQTFHGLFMLTITPPPCIEPTTKETKSDGAQHTKPNNSST